MDENQLGRILAYDPEAIKRNIGKHRSNIVVFTDHIEQAHENIKELEGFLEIIEDHQRKSREIAEKAEQATSG